MKRKLFLICVTGLAFGVLLAFLGVLTLLGVVIYGGMNSYQIPVPWRVFNAGWLLFCVGAFAAMFFGVPSLIVSVEYDGFRPENETQRRRRNEHRQP